MELPQVRRFNRICLVLALLWLVVSIPLGILKRPTIPDFAQFYMGGVLASQGDWKSLYPIPYPGSRDNPGLRIHSFAKPGWRAMCRIRGVPDYTHFILPPQSALMFAPLSLLSYRQAFWLWTFLLIGCAWGVAYVAGRLHRSLVGKPSYMEGVLALMIVLSPLTARAIRISNVSPPIALLLGLALLATVARGKNWNGAVAVLFGAILKYATLILTPLLVATRRWKMLAWLVGLGLFATILTYAVAGPAPFIEYYEVIMPTLGRPSRFQGNQSLPGMLARVFGRPFAPSLAAWLTLARLGTLGGILYLFVRTRAEQWRRPEKVLAGAALLVSWLLIFSPIAWEHWPIFLCPVWGWLLWEARVSGVRRVLAILALALMYVPAGIFQVAGFWVSRVRVPEPYNSWQLAGVLLVFILGVWRFMSRDSSRAGDVPGARVITET